MWNKPTKFNESETSKDGAGKEMLVSSTLSGWYQLIVLSFAWFTFTELGSTREIMQDVNWTRCAWLSPSPKKKVSLLHIQCIVSQLANTNECHSVPDMLGSLQNISNIVPDFKEQPSC